MKIGNSLGHGWDFVMARRLRIEYEKAFIMSLPIEIGVAPHN